MPADGTILTVYPNDGTTRANEAIVVSQEFGIIEILDFVQNDSDPAGTTYKFDISGIANQISAKEAGSFIIETYYKDPATGDFYLIDFAEFGTSFSATTGILTADTSLTIDSPVNNKEGTIYTFSYTEASMVPAGGFIDISFPDDIQFDSV